MEGDINDTIKDIGAMLGISDIPDGIGDLVASFLGNNTDDSSDKEVDALNAKSTLQMLPKCEHSENDDFDDSNSDFDISKLIDLFGKFRAAREQARNDPNLRLLKALAPFLDNKRRSRIGNCEKIIIFLKMSENTEAAP